MAKLAKKVLEKDTMRLVTDWLSANKLFHVRMNTYSGKTQSGAWMRQGRKGMADIVVMPKRYHINIQSRPFFEIVWCEVKAPRGQQSPEQRLFQQEVEREGMSYHIIRSLEDLLRIFA